MLSVLGLAELVCSVGETIVRDALENVRKKLNQKVGSADLPGFLGEQCDALEIHSGCRCSRKG